MAIKNEVTLDFDARAIVGSAWGPPTFSPQVSGRQDVQRLCNSLITDSRAFSEWISLVKIVEQCGPPQDVKAIYVAFLEQFPLCYGYWKRLVDLEMTDSGLSLAAAWYERAVAVAASSIDIWLHYLDLLLGAHGKGLDEPIVSVASIRGVVDRALDAVGLNWYAAPLWLKCIDFEEANDDWKRLGELFRRALAIPLEGLNAVHVRFRALVVGDFIGECDNSLERLQMLCTADEAKLLVAAESGGTVLSSITDDTHPEKVPQSVSDQPHSLHMVEEHEAAKGKDVIEIDDDDYEEGEILPDEIDPELVLLPPGSEGFKNDKGSSQIQISGNSISHQLPSALQVSAQMSFSRGRCWLLQCRTALFERTREEVDRLREFEASLTRPYFHNEPLSLVQVSTWRRFLDAEVARHPRDEERLRALFQRCLVPCNNYFEFWSRFADHLEGTAGIDAAREMLENACLTGRLRGRPDALVALAELEEQCGMPERAQAILDLAMNYSMARGSAEIALRRVALEFRTSGAEKAVSMLRGFMQSPSDASAKLLLTIRYAHICEHVLGRPHDAIFAFERAWSDGHRNANFVASYVGLVLRTGISNNTGCGDLLTRCSNFFKKALQEASNCRDGMTEEQQASLWACYIDVLLARGAPIDKLRSAQARGRQLCSSTSLGNMSLAMVRENEVLNGGNAAVAPARPCGTKRAADAPAEALAAGAGLASSKEPRVLEPGAIAAGGDTKGR
eukprot:TRINITY_DN66140_c0_g1_i1.p1 TRINITY_DN66140_c0_g1~~TRINITY_DN66140_c0_g1_i1.p1  ORF type:complete len:751 (+),score=128.39 TRINITY_DN66140_c0_g1_i1:58-2253(+)